jgi:hypothetical protein
MAAGDMANNGATFDAQARYAALDERVTNLRTSMVNLEGEMRSGFTSLNSHLSSISSEMRAGQKTAWPVIWSAIGVSFAILIAIGSQALSPIRDSVADLKTSVEARVTHQELDDRATRGSEDRARTEAALIDLRAKSVARDEWMQQIHGRDVEVAELGRRIEEIRQSLGNQYTTRDLLLELQREVSDLRQRVSGGAN